MAITLTHSAHLDRFATSATPNELTRVDFPQIASTVFVTFETNAGKVARTGTDGAAIGADYELIQAGVKTLIWSRGAPSASRVFSVYVTSATGSTNCAVSWD